MHFLSSFKIEYTNNIIGSIYTTSLFDPEKLEFSLPFTRPFPKKP